MGASMAWVAVQSKDDAAVLRALNATPTADHDELFESELAGVRLRDGWYLIVAQGCDSALVSDESLSTLSRIGPLVACSLEEHVMFSSARSWRDGRQIWSVSHDAEQDVLNLETDGDLPEIFSTLRASAVQAQEQEGGSASEVDHIFEAPLSLAQHLTGFKHDESPDCFGDAKPVRLERMADRARPWWKFWG